MSKSAFGGYCGMLRDLQNVGDKLNRLEICNYYLDFNPAHIPDQKAAAKPARKDSMKAIGESLHCRK
jgi:hypothetical protein